MKPRLTRAGKVQALYLIDPELRDCLRLHARNQKTSMSMLVEEAIRNTYMTPPATTPNQEHGDGIIGMFRTLIDPR